MDHLRAGARTPFAWGSCDCALWAADWVRARTGKDPAEGFRGRYSTAGGAAVRIARFGTLLDTVREAMEWAGFAETAEPRLGDVGVVETPVGPALAIRTVIGWAAKGERGIVCDQFPVHAAWSLG